MMLKPRFLTSISEITADHWDSLFCSDYPFIRHAFLHALEDTGCVSEENGWMPQHLLLMDGDQAVAAMPLYRKAHSYGEFVFDWGWAEAYSRHGLNYYPKLVTAIPFSPVAGPRIGIAAGHDDRETTAAMLKAVSEHAGTHDISSWHLLFPDSKLTGTIRGQKECLHRQAVQFRWFNRQFGSFQDYLASMRSSRRKNTRRERRKVAENGVLLERKCGADISEKDWASFYQCYRATYQKRSGHDGYLSRAFFDMLLGSLRQQIMLVVAKRDDIVIATSMFLFDRQNLYGRYWGALEEIPFLHFEACLYQGIEFCIEQGLAEFDPGTQGEHKLMRGFEPVKSSSWHWIADLRFRAAIEDFLRLEKTGNNQYQERAAEFLPYRKNG